MTDADKALEIQLAGELLALDIETLEERCLLQDQADCPVQHHFGPGVYMREVFLPAGALVIGHAHREASMNIMLKGEMVLLVDGQVSVVRAPFMTVSQPGRKVAYVLEDTVWMNVHATEETDIAKLEARYVDKSPAFRAQQRLLEEQA